MSLDLVSFDAALKQHYTNDTVEMMVYKDNPFLALVKKMEDFGGRNLPIPLIYGNPQGRSASFTNAQTRGQVTNSKLADFVLTRVKDYSIATIDNETLEASKGNANAFMEAATTEIDGAINTLTRSLATALFRSGFGDIGQVASISSNTITLLSEESVTNFEVGMVLVASATQGSSVLRAGSAIIVAVDRTAGTITVDSAAGITGLAANDFLFVQGDRENSATPVRLKVSGLEAWIPSTTPTSTPFFGVDRSVDTRLGGLRIDGSALPIEEALIDAAALAAREGAKIDHFFMSYEKYAELEKALGSKVQYIDLQVKAEIGFRGIMINGPRGPIKCIPDQNCPSDRIFGLQMDMWKLYSLGKAVRVIDSDGLQMLRQANADGVEVRYGFYGNLGCRAPGYNVNIKV
jgi:hypothetical protein